MIISNFYCGGLFTGFYKKTDFLMSVLECNLLIGPRIKFTFSWWLADCEQQRGLQTQLCK
jgi:hypothetical protein